MAARAEKTTRILFVLFAVAFVTRLLFGILFVGLDTAPAGDAATYDQIAHNLISEGKYVQYHGTGMWLSFRPPLLPFVLAGLYSIVGYSFTASRLLMIIIGSLLPLVVFALTRRVFGKRAAIIAGVVSAVYPSFVLYSNTLHTEGLFVVLLYLLIMFLIRFADGMKTVDICVAGVIAGLGCLCRPTLLAFVPVCILWLLITGKRGLLQSLRAAVLLVVLAGAVIAPWTYRNYSVHGEFVPIASRGGVTLWLGNNRWATGNIANDYEKLREVMPDTGTLTETQSSRFFRQEAMKYIKTYPQRFVVLGVKRVFHLWRPEGFRFPGLVEKIPRMGRFAIGFLSYVPFFLLFLVGVVLLLKGLRLLRDPPLLLFTFLVVTFTLVHAVFASMPRYRQPLEPAIILIGSWALIVILDALRGRRAESA
jgi:4-amino-4-deoxy-L-arabinose transferase-like glycosyltransferase